MPCVVPDSLQGSPEAQPYLILLIDCLRDLQHAMDDQFSQPMQRARAAVRALHRMETLTRTSSARRSRPSECPPNGQERRGTSTPVDVETGPTVSAERASSWNPGAERVLQCSASF